MLACRGAIPIGSSLVVGFVHLAAESLRVPSRRRLGQIRKLFRNHEPAVSFLSRGQKRVSFEALKRPRWGCGHFLRQSYTAYPIDHNKPPNDSDCRRPARRDKSALSSSQHPPSRHQRPAKSVSFPALFRVPLLRFGVLSLRSILRMFLGGHESSPAAAAYTASRHGGKRHDHAQRLRRHRADVQDPEHAARGACFAREVEQAVAVVPVLRPARLDLGGNTVGERFR